MTASSGAFSFSNGGQTSVPALTNNGQLSPSAAPTGTPTLIGVTGDYTQSASGVLNLNIGGATCANSDALNVTGTATVASGATLNVFTVALCTSPTQPYLVLQAGPPIIGGFTAGTLPPRSPPYTIQQTSNIVKIV